MAIDAVVDKVCYTEEGCVLHLRDRDRRSCRGQKELTILDPPPGLEVLEGMTIWGSADECYMGKNDKLVLERVGYTRLRIKPPRTEEHHAPT